MKVEGFRYVKDAKLCLVLHSAGTEEMFTTEQPPAVAALLASISEVLVAHINDEGTTCDEYTVPVEHNG